MQARLHRLASLLLWALGVQLLASPVHAQTPAQAGPTPQALPAPKPRGNAHLRLLSSPNAGPNTGEPTALQSAITRYKDPHSALSIDLVAAVHVGEASYYAELNERLKDYDAVLYELVAPPGVRPEQGKVSVDNPMTFFAEVMKSMLGLELQINKINYQRPNFVHADLSPAELSAIMKQRGETWLTLALGTVIEILYKGQLKPATGDAAKQDLLSALDDSRRLKRILAESMVASTGPGLSLGGPLKRLLIVDRNKAALRVLQTQIAQGKRRIAIFFGAAHLPDMEQRLKRDLKVKLESRTYITAWDLTRGTSGSSSLFPKLLRLLQAFATP